MSDNDLDGEDISQLLGTEPRMRPVGRQTRPPLIPRGYANWNIPTRPPPHVKKGFIGQPAIHQLGLPPPTNYVNSSTIQTMRDLSVPVITKIVEKELKRTLLPMEIRGIEETLFGMDVTNVRGRPVVEVEKEIAAHVIKQLLNQTSMLGKFDMQQYLAGEIGEKAEANFVRDFSDAKAQTSVEIIDRFDLARVLGKDTIHGMQSVLNPRALDAYANIALDTRYHARVIDDNTRYKWNYSSSNSASEGTFNTIAVVRDILEMKILPFRIPYPADGNGYNAYRKTTMYIEEFGSQSFIGHENRRYHFAFTPVKNDNWIELTPHNDGIYRFDRPFTQLDSITISFGSPLEIITFDKDRLDCTFTTGSPTVITFAENHNLETGDVIYFTDFNTGTPTTDAATISTMNRKTGHAVQVTSDTTLTIAIDTTGITPSPSSITCYFGAKRIMIDMELKFKAPPS